MTQGTFFLGAAARIRAPDAEVADAKNPGQKIRPKNLGDRFKEFRHKYCTIAGDDIKIIDTSFLLKSEYEDLYTPGYPDRPGSWWQRKRFSPSSETLSLKCL